MQVDGITWHAVVLKRRAFAAMAEFAEETLGLKPLMSHGGRRLYVMRNGTMLDLYTPDAVPDYGLNDGIVIGFQVDDIEKASRQLAQAGHELLGTITRLAGLPYSHRHFRGPDGSVYGLVQVQPIDW